MAMARCQKVVALRRREKTLATIPPTRPTKTEMVVSRGTVMRAARTRGEIQFAAGVGAHGAHGVDLLGDQHGAEFGGDAGGAAAGDEQAGDGRAEFADEREGNDIAGEGNLAEALKLRAGLQHHDRADEKSGEKDDGKRADADVVHLVESVLAVAGRSEEIGEGTHGHAWCSPEPSGRRVWRHR